MYKNMLSANDAAQILGVSLPTLRTLPIKHTRITPARARYNKADLDAYIESVTIDPKREISL